MTTAQLDHLRAIEAHLDRLLAIAAKRTPGEWDASGSKNEVIGNNEYGFISKEEVCCSPGRGQFWPENSSYIVACSNNAERAWRSTKALIGIIIQDTWAQNADELTETILKQWPRETLKP